VDDLVGMMRDKGLFQVGCDRRVYERMVKTC